MEKLYPRAFDLRSGTITIGIISIILSLHEVINNLVVEGYFESVYERKEQVQMLGIFPFESCRLPFVNEGGKTERIIGKEIVFNPSFFIPHVLTYGIGILGYIAFPFIYFFISVIFLWAAIDKKKYGILMWYIWMIISVALNIAALIYAHVIYPLPPIYHTLHHLLFYGLEIYFIIMVKSCYNQISKDIQMKGQRNKFHSHQMVPLETVL